ncbi:MULTISPECIES: hypothetical protein [Anaerostipes]|uniref:hypothetical protein n=1 Tax=Anaerostipes TaxID=207244 RepID=UPI0011783892|nr:MULTISPECIES: hypothetical protein [Anaerostipes]MCI5623700.1 hypothetical protein [Anaerostipes sp.]MDY2727112.1 hypothetical protein [Anaerostipes faecalis]
MKHNIQWFICIFLIVFVILALWILDGQKKDRLEDGTLVLERTWKDDGLYQGGRQCLFESAQRTA